MWERKSCTSHVSIAPGNFRSLGLEMRTVCLDNRESKYDGRNWSEMGVCGN